MESGLNAERILTFLEKFMPTVNLFWETNKTTWDPPCGILTYWEEVSGAEGLGRSLQDFAAFQMIYSISVCQEVNTNLHSRSLPCLMESNAWIVMIHQVTACLTDPELIRSL